MDRENEQAHLPVMPSEALDLMALKPGDVVVDCTVGMGGHSERILENILPGGKLIAIDRDHVSLKKAEERLSRFEGSFYLFRDNFTNFKYILQSLNIKKVDSVLFDLGISSFQLASGRGFSFREDSFLDMRMDENSNLSAYDIVNYYSEREIALIIKNFGEDRFAFRIARGIIDARKEKPIETTKDLVDAVIKSIPRSYVRGRIHPATRTFQALRIAVNSELENISSALSDAIEALLPEGRIVVISFHSLEDRIVKRTFRDHQKNGCFEILTPKPISPGELELEMNSRSRSAKLRAGRKLKNIKNNLLLKIFML
ncbi:MAG TPA: 16S rRNA (cytosine(1402)-N(4))-methyltransferase RsmH [Candidatus Omnitrophica bacterium]|nr:16S rRNA (cytosine(1402)-N(4))-methyltransferase RsmH [Candidatus Omnitrophota bacterium]